MNTVTRSSREKRWAAGALALALLMLTIGAGPIRAAGPKPSLTGVVNVNTATSDQLKLLPGVGPSRADAIVAVRKQRGGFKSVDELTQVKGIGSAMLERMRPHLTLTGRTTARPPDGAEPASTRGRPKAHR